MTGSGSVVNANMNIIQGGRVKIIDNWLDTELINHLSERFLYHYPHHFVEKSLNTKPIMYSYDFTPGDTLVDFLSAKVQNQVTSNHNITFTRIYFNVAHPGMNGMFHVDSKDPSAGPSIMLMVTPKGEGGEFYYKPDPDDNLSTEKVEYEQNRLLIFDAHIEHYGASFKDKPRITLVFKTYVEAN